MKSAQVKGMECNSFYLKRKSLCYENFVILGKHFVELPPKKYKCLNLVKFKSEIKSLIETRCFCIICR